MHTRSVRADPGRRAPGLGQGASQGWPVASGAHPLRAPGRAQAVPAPQGAARGKQAGRSGRAAGAGSGPREGRGGEGSSEGGLPANTLGINPLPKGACHSLAWDALPVSGKTPTYLSKPHHHAASPT